MQGAGDAAIRDMSALQGRELVRAQRLASVDVVAISHQKNRLRTSHHDATALPRHLTGDPNIIPPVLGRICLRLHTSGQSGCVLSLPAR